MTAGRWRKGQSGNPAGRRARDGASGDIGASLIELLASPHTGQRRTPRTTAEAVAMGLLRRANEGDVSAVRQIRALTEQRAAAEAAEAKPWDRDDPADARSILKARLDALAQQQADEQAKAAEPAGEPGA